MILGAGLTKGMESDSNTQRIQTTKGRPSPSPLVAPGKFVKLPVYFMLSCASCWDVGRLLYSVLMAVSKKRGGL